MTEGGPIRFREATQQDFSTLLRMMQGLAEQPPSLPFDQKEVCVALDEFVKHPEFGRVWLILLGERLAGYVILTLGFSFEYRGPDAFIDELYVEPEYRRMGCGRRAMEFVAERAADLGVNALHLEVDEAKDAAMELYRRAGFEDHERHLMTKWLRRGRR